MAFRSFDDFWPHYVRAHSKPRTRLFHAAGSALSVVVFGAAFPVNLWLLLAVPVVGYGFAWSSHFFIEHNKPATFSNPFYSLYANYHMLFLMMAGRMDEEIAKYVSPGVSGPASPAGSPAA
ncbi:MAG TPA: DUF962 domain-containing protein [Thermoanaerobaculia bacterium]|nr:DUF962 domain-containing protein [Thermoanaerobaculia bacterium]